MINVRKNLRVMLAVCRSLTPAPGCSPNSGHIARAGARASQKHCKNFSNLKPCKFSALSQALARGGGRAGTVAGELQNTCEMSPVSARHLCIYLRQVRKTGREDGRGGWVCFVQICKLSWRGRPGPLGKLVSARNSSLCRHPPQVSAARVETVQQTNKASIKISRFDIFQVYTLHEHFQTLFVALLIF